MVRETVRTAAPTLLLIEDDAPVARFAATALRLEGYAVRTAATGSTGLEAARRELPDVIVLDLHLPGLNGAEVLRALRADPATAAVTVLVLTASASATDERLVRALGVADYLRKPIAAGDLVGAVRHALGTA